MFNDAIEEQLDFLFMVLKRMDGLDKTPTNDIAPVDAVIKHMQPKINSGTTQF